ncbi:MAG: BrnT family toxin [Bacteroidota bacterium]
MRSNSSGTTPRTSATRPSTELISRTPSPFSRVRCWSAPVIGGEEPRFVAVGMVQGVEIAVVFTDRGTVIRLISARRARKNEREAYHQAFAERP